MFADKMYLLFLIVIPILCIFFFYAFQKRKRDLFLFISKAKFSSLSNVKLHAYVTKYVLIITALIFMILALARPQFGKKEQTTTRQYSDIVIALDVSKSMLSEDVKPSRLEKAKIMISSIIETNPDDKIGIIAFAGSAMWQCPMTHDLVALKMFLQEIAVGTIPLGGTQISGAISLAAKALENKPAKSKTLILISDGEDHDSQVKEALSLAKNVGLRIISVAIGSSEGSPIPIKDKSGVITDYVKDAMENIVMSKVNSVLLKEVAQDSGGQYFEAFDKDITPHLVKAVRDLEKNTNSLNRQNDKVDRFQIFVLICLLFLFGENLIALRRKENEN
ncbi:MAG: VWA domain-containing protein [Elusimicrobiota bacterium]|jgi:Ca-activated chloride channel family protein|nr:VWA domain-containing protein [Elusimicrobiota bacterium]